MNNTLKNGDRIVLLKDPSSINRGDVVVFKKDNDILIKRCIGLPKDTIHIINGKIVVNNKIIPPPKKSIIGKFKKNDIFVKSIMYNSFRNNWTPDNLGTYIVPYKGMRINNSHKIKLNNEDYYFLIGDNREISIDSRIFGPIEKSNIIGKVIFNF